MRIFFILLLLMPFNQLAFAKPIDSSLKATAVAIPGGEGGVGFDDLGFSTTLQKVLVPGGQIGKIFLIDPVTKAITAIEGLGSPQGYKGGHGEGVTSVDEGDGALFAIDRNAMRIYVIDPVKKTVITSAVLANSPDYVRFVKKTSEVWVTQPSSQTIEIFKFSKKPTPTLSPDGFIAVAGGPESLVVDQSHQRAYTHLWKGKTAVIDLLTRTIKEQWNNGCEGSRGISLDEKRGFLFVGCVEGKAIVLDINKHGLQLSSLRTPPGVDVIGYNSKLVHVYVSSAKGSSVSVIGISDLDKLSLLGMGQAAEGAHCATGDDQGNIWVCDPQHGQLLQYKDSF